MRGVVDVTDKRLLAVLVGAAVLRIAVAAWPALSHADELWQYMEPARRIVAGRWIETWDLRAGIRSWLLPLMLSGPMAIGYALAPFSRLDLFLARLFCVGIAMLGIVASIDMGWRLSRRHGLVVGIATAGWFELAYFGPRTAAEPVATSFALIAAALLSDRTPRLTVTAGLLLCLGCAIRLQYLPAFAVLALGMTGFDRRGWLHLAAGAMVGLALSAVSDLIMGAVPFRWIWRTYSINLLQGKAATFGTQPFWWYGTEAWKLYGPGVIVLSLLAFVGGKRYPALLCSVVVNLLVHSLIAHKEYRFVFYSSAVTVLLAAIGSVDLWPRHAGSKNGRRMSPAILGVVWLLWSAASAAWGEAASTWGVDGRLVAAWKVAGEIPDVCGMAVYGINDMPVASYALFGRDVPIYRYDTRDRLAGVRSRAYNVALTQHRFGADLGGFELVACDRLNYFCVYHRPGTCVRNRSDVFHDENLYLIRQGR